MAAIRLIGSLEIQNPAIKKIASRLIQQASLAMDKVVLNHFEPDSYPMPTGASLENTLKSRFAQLSDDRRQAARLRVKARREQAGELRKLQSLGLESIDLRQGQSVAQQVVRLNRPALVALRAQDLEQERSAVLARPATTTRAPSDPGQTARSLELAEVVRKLKAEYTRDPIHFEDRIGNKHRQMGGDAGVLGKLVQRHGWWAQYERGVIVVSDGTAHEVHGSIGGLYKRLGGVDSFLGLPLTDETKTPDQVGRYNHFQGGSIYWSPETGAHEVHGAIREKWKSLGWERSHLGYPITSETGTPDQVGRFNHFQKGSIYWTPQTGAWEVHGEIRDFWSRQGWERGALGYPRSDEFALPDGGRCSRFQGGEVRWYPRTGAYLASNLPTKALTLRCIRLHCIDETGSSGPGEWGGDEMAMGGTLIEITSSGASGRTFGLVDLEGDWDDGNWNCWSSPRPLVSSSLTTGDQWPRAFIATCALVEVDNGGGAAMMNDLLAQLLPVARQELEKALIAAGTELGGAIGGAIGWVAAQIANAVIDKIAKWFTDMWNDDVFAPFSVAIELLGPNALFAGGRYESDDIWVKSTGHNGCYEFWIDWALET